MGPLNPATRITTLLSAKFHSLIALLPLSEIYSFPSESTATLPVLDNPVDANVVSVCVAGRTTKEKWRL